MGRNKKPLGNISLFARRFHYLVGNKNYSEFERINGLSKGVVQKVLHGSEPTRPTLEAIIKATKCNALWLISGEGLPFNQSIDKPFGENDDGGSNTPFPLKAMQLENAPTPIAMLPKSNAIRRKGDEDAEHPILSLNAVGNAAALGKGANRLGGFDDVNMLWDKVEIPETTHLVRIRGDSMSPMIMSGQFAMVGPEYTHYLIKHGRGPEHREIVIVDVTVQENDIGGVDSDWEGVHCKRIQDAGDFWEFTSINPSGESFNVAKDNCRLWPVIGVFFAGKGKPPTED